MKTLITFVVALALSTAGCATSPRMNKLSVGMTKDEVLDILGSPDSTSAKGGAEYLSYMLHDGPLGASANDYMVKLVNGKVDSFGHYRDVVPPRTPAIRIQHENVNSNQPSEQEQ